MHEAREIKLVCFDVAAGGKRRECGSRLRGEKMMMKCNNDVRLLSRK